VIEMTEWKTPIPKPTKEWLAEKVLTDDKYVIAVFSPMRNILVSSIKLEGEGSEGHVELHMGQPGGSTGTLRVTMNTTVEFNQPMNLTERCVVEVHVDKDFSGHGMLTIGEKKWMPGSA
jgi:hypothetical protein